RTPDPLAGRPRELARWSGPARALPLRHLHDGEPVKPPGRSLVAAVPPEGDAAPGAPPRGAIVFGVMLGPFLGAMESTAVATAMPTVIATLGGLSVYSWVFSGYILAATIAMPLWGKAADLYGRRSAYLVGLAIFLSGSILSGLATSMTGLI